jgi:nicotinate-nucleotide adenylyltransferase
VTRTAFFGGTFDPIHQGHLDVARAARRALSIDSLSLLPAHTPPHRAVPVASAAHRFAMTALAAADERLPVSDLDMRASDPSYTSVTLDRLRAQGLNTQAVFMVIGADAFAEIATWKNYPALLDRCHFVVVSRPGRPAPALRRTLPALADRMIDAPPAGGCAAPDAPRIFLVDAPTAPVSSTDVRTRLAAGLPVTQLVPASVEHHIVTNGLYQARDRGLPGSESR